MSIWVAKRFWTTAATVEVQNGFGVSLDGRLVKTPAKAGLHVPTKAMAQAIAREWDAQEGEIDPTSMPLTRAANAAIDKVGPQHAEVAAYIAEYGGTDLLCYRAGDPPALVQRQAQAWDPMLEWAQTRYGVHLVRTTGVLPVDQDATALATLHAQVVAMDAFELSALHDLVGISGSLVLGLAVTQGALSGQQAWDLSRVDENYQISQWGEDEEAAELAAFKRAALLSAEEFWRLRHS
ncbi:ATPase [Rhodobacteraceae bacterium]|nr:ATPase [Paracoccaceae bacterium]